MASKLLRNDDVENFETLLTVFGEKRIHSFSTRQNRAVASAAFNRKKPKPVTLTAFRVQEVLYNPEPYTSGDPAGIFRQGTLTFAHGSTPVTIDRLFDDGKFNLNRARAKIAGRGRDLGEALIELDQTINLIKKNVNRVGRIGDAMRNSEWPLLDHLIRGKTPNRLKSMAPSKRLANGYLEIMFGILPLLESSHLAVEAYRLGLLKRGQKVRAVSGGVRHDLNVPLKEWDKNVGRATVSGIVRNPHIATLNSYGLLNPALMLWQRQPYSFVIDWFIPIAPILGSLAAPFGLTRFEQLRTAVSGQDFNNDLGWDRRTCTYDRVVVNDVLPPIGNPFGKGSQLSLGQLASAVALIRQRF